MALKRVVVTGIGALTPIGNTAPEFWEGLKSGKSGSANITHFDAEKFKTRFACEVKNFVPENFIDKNGLIVGFLVIGVLAFLSEVFSKKVLKGYLPGSAIAILAGLILAYFGGIMTNGEKGLSDLPFLKGVGTFGGSMFRDFTIVATAMGASYLTMKKAGWLGLVSLLFGIVFLFSCLFW